MAEQLSEVVRHQLPKILLCAVLLAALPGYAQQPATSYELRSQGAGVHRFDLPPAPVLLELDEWGRNLKLSLLDAELQRLATFDTPGRSLGKLVVLIEAGDYPAAQSIEVSPRRVSSSPGRYQLTLSTPERGSRQLARIITKAALDYAGAGDRAATIEQFAAGAGQAGPWQEWVVYWAAVAENEYGSREKALQRLADLPRDPQTLVEFLRVVVAARANMYLLNYDTSAGLFDQVEPRFAQLATQHPLDYTAALIGIHEYQCAIRVYQRGDTKICSDAVSAAKILGDPYLVGLLSNNIAANQIGYLGRPEAGLLHAEAAAKALEASGKQNYDVAANAYLTFARANERLGRFTQAQIAIQHAVNLQLQHDRKTNLGWAYSRAAELYGMTGDYVRSSVYGENAVRLLRETDDHELAARAAVALAETYLLQNSPERAMQHANEALLFYRSRCGRIAQARSSCGSVSEHGKAQMMAALARVANSQVAADVMLSRAEAEQAIAAITRIDTTQQESAAFDVRYADLLAGLGDTRAAQARLESALDTYTFLKYQVGQVEVLARRAELYYSSGQFVDAYQSATAATDLLAAVELQLTSERLGPAFRSKLFDQFGLRIAAMLAVERHDHKGKRDLAENVFRIAVESLGPHNQLSRMPPDPALDVLLTDLTQAITARVSAREAIAAEQTSDVGLPEDAAVALAVDAVEAHFRRTGTLFSTRRQPIELVELRSRLDDDEALIHYVWWREKGWAVVITTDGINLHEIGEIPVAAFADIRGVNSRASESAAGIALGARLLPDLPARITRLYVIPDGPLHVVPLGALSRFEGTSEPILGRYTISYLSSYDGFRDSAPDTVVQVERGAAIFANPIFAPRVRHSADERQISPEKALQSSWFEDLQPLPWSELEASGIAQLLERTDVYLGARASKTQLRAAETQNKAIWHFATHGYFSSDFADIAGIVFSQVDEYDRRQDGLFTIQDARAVPTRADLIVLNGCETGLGTTFRGEGVMGFTRAFISRGVGNTISTVWRVPDRAAQEIMVDFYRELVARDGVDVAEALATAQRNYLKRNSRHRMQPIYWGGYIHHQL